MTDTLAGQFIGQGFHFGVSLFAALACLAAGWLYLDAWSASRHKGEIGKGIGFLLLTVAFIITGATWSDPTLLDAISAALKLIGYSAIAWGHIIEPLNPKPKTTGYIPDSFKEPQTSPATTTAPAVMSLGTVSFSLSALVPAAAGLTSFMYWRLATTGLERHLKPLAWAFSIFTISELLALTAYWQHDANPILQTLVAPLGICWILQHLAVMGATIILGRWVWRYLTKRLFSQLFLTITTLTFNIALIATIGVAALLLSSLQHDALASLRTNTNVLSYAVETKSAETRTAAEVLAGSPQIITAALNRDQAVLATAATGLMLTKHLSETIITDETGVILARASDPDRIGDSLSDNSLVQHALLGTTSSTLAVSSGALVPVIITSTASPIMSNGQVIGLAITHIVLDNNFVDGLKRTTGLDSTIYTGTTRSATSIVASDHVSRPIGTKETHSEVLSHTFTKGETWQGSLSIAGTPYLAVFMPLKDITNTTIGMLFIGQPQSAVLQTAQNAIRLTFAAASFSLILIMTIVFFVARGIIRQLR